MQICIYTSKKPIPYMGPGPGRAHVLSEEGCRVGPGPAGPGTLARALAALLAERVGPARAWAHVRYRFFGCIYTYLHAYM